MRRGILRGHCAEQSRRACAAPHRGGGVLCRHARVPEHPSGVAVPLGPMLGRAGPGSLSGGGASSRVGGSGRGAPPPFPGEHTGRAAACRVRPCPVPCASRAPLPYGWHCRSSAPPPPRPACALAGGGGGRPAGPPLGGEGGARGLMPRGRAAPEARRSRSPRPPSALPPSSCLPTAGAGRRPPCR